MNFSHYHFLILYSPATFNMFHETREVTLSARKSIPSKNNFRGITMGIGPIWGITSLTFILSCARVIIKDKAGSSPLDRLNGRNIFGVVWWPSNACVLRNWTDQASISSRLDRPVARWKVALENTQNFICLCFNVLALQRPAERARNVNA